MLVASTSAAGMYFWRPATTHPVLGFALSGWDWRLLDERRPPASNPNTADNAAIAAGVFDAAWHRDERWTIEADVQRRAGWKLRRAPAPVYAASITSLQAVAGSYEIVPGFLLQFVNHSGELIARAPGVRMVAESELAFVHPMTGDSLEFVRDPERQGERHGAGDFGRTIFARSMP